MADNENMLQKEAKMMETRKSIRARESVSEKEFPVSIKEVLARYETLYTGAINDVMREFCLFEPGVSAQYSAAAPRAHGGRFGLHGKELPERENHGEMTFRSEMLDAMHEDSFVVWDTSLDEEATLWGGVMTATAVGKKVRAACIDGGIRDTHQILEKDFPVFYRYRVSNGSLGRCLITHYQIPVKIGNVTVKPGDIIMGDIDGVLCVPREIAWDVLVRAEEIRENEKKIFSWVNAGETIDEITKKGGYF